MDITQRLLELFLARRYQLTDHAQDSMDEDRLTTHDVLCCIPTGRLRRSWPRERKFEIEGRSIDGRAMRVIAQLPEPRCMRIITVYEVT